MSDHSFSSGKYLLLVAIALFSCLSVYSRQENQHSLQSWYNWQNRLRLGPRLDYTDDLGLRRIILSSDWWGVYYRPAIKINAGAIVELYAGAGFWYTHQTQKTNTWEIRPWQGVKVNWPNISRFSFDLFLRLEERFNYSIEEQIWDSSVRARYKINMTIPLNYPAIYDRTWYAGLNAEVFLDLGESVAEKYVNKGRFAVGVGYRPSARWRFDFQYMTENSRPGGNDPYNLISHVIQFKVRNFMTGRKNG